MPRIKGRKGPTPTLAIGQPYRPTRQRPKLIIPESVTAYGDDTGEPLFRMGDRADGVPESVSVTPMIGKPSDSTSYAPAQPEPMSLATGGLLTIGGGQVGGDPQAEALRRRREMLQASRNVTDLSQNAMGQYARNASDEAYGAYGVQPPPSINAPQGARIGSSLVRANFRPQTDYLQERYQEEDLARDEASFAQQQQSGGVFLASPRMRAGGGGESRGTQSPSRLPVATKSRPPTKLPTPQEPIDLLEQQEMELSRKVKEAKLKGLVPYDDPYNPTGDPIFISPAEARLRKSADDQKFKDEQAYHERQRTKGSGDLFPQASPAQLIADASDGLISLDDFRQTLRAKGFDETEVTAAVKRILKNQNDDRIRAARQAAIDANRRVRGATRYTEEDEEEE